MGILRFMSSATRVSTSHGAWIFTKCVFPSCDSCNTNSRSVHVEASGGTWDDETSSEGATSADSFQLETLRGFRHQFEVHCAILLATRLTMRHIKDSNNAFCSTRYTTQRIFLQFLLHTHNVVDNVFIREGSNKCHQNHSV